LGTYSRILVTTPAPTVRPPSRIAKRRPSSMAMGVISSPISRVLSPGMIISVPSGRRITPVTSVVLKVELGTVPFKERSVAAALFLGQDVNLSLELGVGE